MQKIDWINGQAGGTPLSAENLNLMESYIESEFNNQAGDITDVSDELTKLETYSTTEQKIGKWINGDDLYRKVVSCGTLPNNANKDVAHGISNFGKLIKGYGYTSNGTYYLPLPFPIAGAEPTTSISFFVSSSQIRIFTGTDRRAYTETYIVLEYTKSA